MYEARELNALMKVDIGACPESIYEESEEQSEWAN